MRVKRYMIVSVIWLCVLGVVAVGKNEAIPYEIFYDSTTTETYAIKNEVLHRYAQVMEGVHEESVATMLLHNLDVFMWEKDMQATWSQNHLQIIIGDGQGPYIEGDLETNAVCFPEVKPKSLLAQFFQ